MTSLFDNQFSTITTPFGFDSVSVGAGDTLEVAPLALDTASLADSGVGTHGSAAAVLANHKAYPWQEVEGARLRWKDVQPARYDQFVVPTALDALLDNAKAQTLAGNPYKVIIHLSCGADAPVGPAGADWMTGTASGANNSKPVNCASTVSVDINVSPSVALNIPLPWSDNHRYHYARLIDWLEGTYLSGGAGGLTPAGTRRSDYVMFVAVSFAGVSDGEMTIGYGPHAKFPRSGSVTVDGHTYTSTSQGYIDDVNRTSWRKHVVPTSIRTGSQAGVDDWLRGRYEGAWDWAIGYHMDNLSADSGVTYGSLFADGWAAARSLARKWVRLHGRSKLVSLCANLRVNPPNKANGSPNWAAPKSAWTYALATPYGAGLMALVQSRVPDGTLAKAGFITSDAKNESGGYGCPPADFPYACTDAYQHYGAQFIETYQAVFTDTTYGTGNRRFARETLTPALAANADLVTASAPAGFDNALHALVPTTPAAGAYGTTAFTDVADVFYLLECAFLYTPSAQTLLRSLTSSSDGVLDVVLNPDSTVSALWDGVEVWQSTDLVIDFDTLEVHHVLAGAGGSGFEMRLNGQGMVSSLALDSSGAANAGRLGALDAQPAEVKFTRFAADDAAWVGPAAAPNLTPPTVTIDPLPAEVTVDQVTVTAHASEPIDGLSSVVVSVNDGPAQQMLYSGSGDTYTAVVDLQGSAGQVVSNIIAVTATDSGPVPAITTVTASVDVALPATSGIGGTVAFTRTLLLGVGQFAAMHDRWIAMGHFLEGVAPPEDTAENTGDVTAALSVNPDLGAMTATVSAGWAFVEGDDNLNQGMYADYNDGDVVVTQTAGAPAAGTQRVDVLVAFINDSEHTIRTPADGMAFGFATGQAGAGASLADKSTWPALPPSSVPLCVLLADSGGYSDSIDCRKAYGPALWGEDGNRYRLGVTPDGLLGVERIAPWPDWVAA